MAEDEGAYWAMLTYFDCCKIPIVAHGIDLIEQGIIKDKTNLQFANDIYASVLRQYAHYNDEQVFSIRNYGNYFPYVVQDPSKYIQY